MEKIIISPVSWDSTRQLHYRLIKTEESKTLLLTVWGKTEDECNELSKSVMEKMSK